MFGNYLEEYRRWHALAWGGPAGDCPSADNFISHSMQGPHRSIAAKLKARELAQSDSDRWAVPDSRVR